MKSERRHELETNSLALWLKWRAPELLEKYGTRILLGIVVVALVVVLIRYRINAPKQAAANASDYLNLANEYIQGLELALRIPGDAVQVSTLVRTALDESDDPLIQARGHLTLGDYYWALANYPDRPEAATRPAFKPDLPRNDLLTRAAEAYSKVVTAPVDQAHLKARALLSLGVIAEARARDAEGNSTPQAPEHWKTAREQYEKVLAMPDVPQVFKDEAQWHIDELAKLQQPVWIVADTQPATVPTTASTTAPSTVPAADWANHASAAFDADRNPPGARTRAHDTPRHPAFAVARPNRPPCVQPVHTIRQMPVDADQPVELPVDPDAPIAPETNLPEDEAESDVEHYRFRLSKNLTRRIDQYLVDRVPYLSRAAVQRLIDEGLVKVNGRVVKASYHPRSGDMVEMVAPPKPVSELVPEDIPLEIIYEDEHFLALNKQANLMVHPARGVWTGTLVNGLVRYGQKWSSVNGNWRPGILHRLDRNTTGIMLVAKSDEAHWRIARQFENRTIQKTYVAICHGIPQLLADVIDMPIGRDRYVREKQAVRKLENGGRPAVTRYEVLEQFRFTSPAAVLHTSPHPSDRHAPTPPQYFSFVKLYPKTGRTHQLRVHMMAVGHPLLGDTMYNGRIFELDGFRLDRQALHACEITFVHPGTLEPMTLRAPLPPDMSRLLDILRGRKV